MDQVVVGGAGLALVVLVDLVVWDRAGAVWWSDRYKQSRGEGHEDLVGVVSGDALGEADGVGGVVDGEGRDVAEQEFLRRAGRGEDLDTARVEPVADHLE